MFKKLHSNRDPRDTVMTELRREVGPHFQGAKTRLRSIAESYPRFLFWMMVINISLSAILSFTVFRHKETARKITVPIQTGIDQIRSTTQGIGEMLSLKKQIDSLSAKKQMDRKDSLTLDHALDLFQQLTKRFNK